MAIEDATNQLRNENQSGLDKRLLLPTVAAEQTQQGQSQSDKLFKSLNESFNVVTSMRRTLWANRVEKKLQTCAQD